MHIDPALVADISLDEMQIVHNVESRKIEESLQSHNYKELIVEYQNLTSDVKRYLLMTSLPWAKINENEALHSVIQYIWGINSCHDCDTMSYRPILPIGNMNPRYVIVFPHEMSGDIDQRIMCRGKIASYTRKAFGSAKIYWDCWFTSLLKCGTHVGQALGKEYDLCSRWIGPELHLLNCKNIIFLGDEAQSQFTFSKQHFNTTTIQHPAEHYWKKVSYEQYAESIIEPAIKRLNSQGSPVTH